MKLKNVAQSIGEDMRHEVLAVVNGTVGGRVRYDLGFLELFSIEPRVRLLQSTRRQFLVKDHVCAKLEEDIL
jgi:hypothetical protein